MPPPLFRFFTLEDQEIPELLLLPARIPYLLESGLLTRIAPPPSRPGPRAPAAHEQAEVEKVDLSRQLADLRSALAAAKEQQELSTKEVQLQC